MMSESVVRIMCPNLQCRRILAVPGKARGKTVRCAGCGTNVRIPDQVEPPAPKQKPEEPAANSGS